MFIINVFNSTLNLLSDDDSSVAINSALVPVSFKPLSLSNFFKSATFSDTFYCFNKNYAHTNERYLNKMLNK